MRQSTDKSADHIPIAVALRELRAHLQQLATATILCSVALVLTMIDAFGIKDVIGFAPRLIYMMAMVWLTYSIGFLVAETLGSWLTRAGIKAPAAWLMQGVVAGGFILCAVLGLNLLTFGAMSPGSIFPLALTVIGVTLVITVTLQVLQHHGAQQDRPPPIFDRLSFDKRGTLLSLSAEDHYTNVRTDKGEELILMRFADAIREAAPVEGYQVHRSHWVARAGVQKVQRSKDKAIVALIDGSEIPVSRSFLPALKDAGLLPKTRP